MLFVSWKLHSNAFTSFKRNQFTIHSHIGCSSFPSLPPPPLLSLPPSTVSSPTRPPKPLILWLYLSISSSPTLAPIQAFCFEILGIVKSIRSCYWKFFRASTGYQSWQKISYSILTHPRKVKVKPILNTWLHRWETDNIASGSCCDFRQCYGFDFGSIIILTNS